MKGWMRAACAVSFLAAGLASVAHAQDSSPIKVGHYASMTGKEATFGQSTDQGIRLALKEINAAQR